MHRSKRLFAALVTLAFVGAACAQAPGSTGGTGGTAGNLTKVRLQLQWVPQAQFAGEIAAKAEGYYAAEGLDVELVTGGPNVANITVGCGTTGPEFTLGWVPKALVAVETENCDLVSIAQIFQRSGTRSVAWKDSGITKPADFKGKKVGVWDFGNEYEVTAGAKKAGLTVDVDYTRVIQNFDMVAFLKREIDVAEAMTYNEYAQVLEAINPATGQLYKPEDMNVIDWNKEGSAMLQDAVFARKAWLAQPGNEDIAVRFLRATFKGWMFCRDNSAKCVDHVLAAGTTLGKGHQAWQMNEVNDLIWPSPNGIGFTDQALWAQTIQISTDFGVLKADPGEGWYRNDLVEKAWNGLSGDTKGTSFVKAVVPVTEGGN